MKRILCLLLSALMLFSCTAFGEETVPIAEGKCKDGLFWKYSDGVLTIRGAGEMGAYAYEDGPWDGRHMVYVEKPWAEFLEDITTVVIEEGVSSVGYYSFWDCPNLEKAVLKSAYSIGDKAFFGTKLKEIKYSEELRYIAKHAITKTPLAENNDCIITDGRLLWIKGEIGEKYVVPEGITVLGNSIFRGASDLKEISLPDGLLEIGNGAFYYCESLSSITLPDGLKKIGTDAFRHCPISEFNIPDSVEYIGSGAFSSTRIKEFTLKKDVIYEEEGYYGLLSDCDSLTSVTIENGVEVIPYRFIEYCNGIRNIDIPESVTEIGDYAFCGAYITSFTIKKNVIYGKGVLTGCDCLVDVIIEDGVTKISDSMFVNCRSLTEIKLPESVETIGAEAFSWCINLKNIKLGKNVKEIGHGAFYNCDSFTSIEVPENVTTIPSGFVRWCDKLEKVIIKGEVTSIGRYAFSECNSLKSFTVPESVKVIDAFAFEYCKNLKTVNILARVESIGGHAFSGCESLKRINIPYSVTNMGNAVFMYCSSIESVKLGNIKEIKPSTFYNCTSLKEITLSPKIETIGKVAFYGCKSLEKITIPKSVKTIDHGAFGGCTKLSEVIFEGEVESIAENAFMTK